jgi:ATP-dependent HslUV protease ATP-binding subunit HslU
MERLVEEISFTAEDKTGETLAIDAAYVDAQLADVVGDTDLSKYVL